MNWQMICNDCRADNHHHDTFLVAPNGKRRGDDAGCPLLAPSGYECRCPVDMHSEDLGRICPTCEQSWPGGAR